jgi:Holliday junction resolvase-like predicted endonuclease
MGGDTLMEMSKSRKGDFAEFYAVTWLWDNGYEVFLNAGCSGPIDMIATKDGETVLIDVKTSQYDPRNDLWTVRSYRSDQQKKLGVVYLLFDAETRKLRWVNHRDAEDKQLGLELV